LDFPKLGHLAGLEVPLAEADLSLELHLSTAAMETAAAAAVVVVALVVVEELWSGEA